MLRAKVHFSLFSFHLNGMGLLGNIQFFVRNRMVVLNFVISIFILLLL